MLDAYADAFSRYLRTGTVGALAGFCAEGADLGRLQVYRNGFLKACIDALRANYPSVERLAGEARFSALARPFVEANPPRVASLVEYGEGFPQHIRDTRDLHGLDGLASFAALDRAWTEVCFAEDEAEAAPHAGTTGKAGTPPDPGDRLEAGAGAGGRRGGPIGPVPAGADLDDTRTPSVSSGPGDATERKQSAPGPYSSRMPASAGGSSGDAEALMNLRGRLSPRGRLVSLEHCMLDAWRRLREGEPGVQGAFRQAPRQQVLVWRSGGEVLYRELTIPEHAFIAGVAAGRPCGEAAGDALDLDAEFDLVAAFASLLHHRILSFEH